MQTNKNQATQKAHGLQSQLNLNQDKLITITPDASLEKAARLMRTQHIGDLVVVKENVDRIVGIITDRDIVIETLGQNVQPSTLTVSDIMTRTVITAKITDSPFQLVHLMKKNGITRIPILDIDEELVGVVTAKGLTQLLIAALDDLSHLADQQRTKEMESRH